MSVCTYRWISDDEMEKCQETIQHIPYRNGLCPDRGWILGEFLNSHEATGICWSMLIYVDVCWYMLICVDVTEELSQKNHPKTDDKILIAFGDEFTRAVETSS